jgi:dTDP-4-dehydrorhamnose reductase
METTIAMKKIYMAGCGGMLGAAFYKEFSGGYEVMASDIDLNEEWLTWCDFRDHDAYRKQVLAFRPDYLFHLGAHTDLEYCERHVDDAYMTNTIAVENAVFIANELHQHRGYLRWP